MNFRVTWQACMIAAGLCAGLCACDSDEIRAYRAPKQHIHAGAPETPPASRVVWTVPEGWESVASDQPMRLATFKPGQGSPEVTLSAFPGDSGGLLANINRWRGQLGIAAINEAELSKSSETVTVEGVTVTTVDFIGSAGQAMLGAVIVPGDGQTWFVKATGEPVAIGPLKPAFGALARSFRLRNQTPAPSAVANDVNTRLAAWKPPAHWQVDPNPPTFVTAAFDATNSGGSAKITATMLLNNGGGVLANINRWRDQLGLPPVERLESQPVTDLGRGNLMVDMSAPDGTRRMMAAIVSLGDQTWFFKLTGVPKSVDAERPDFERFVRGVGLGEGSP